MTSRLVRLLTCPSDCGKSDNAMSDLPQSDDQAGFGNPFFATRRITSQK